MELKTMLNDAIAKARQQALANIVAELLTALEANGYSIADFLEALANHLHQTQKSSQVVYFLEQAASEITATTGQSSNS